ncbi:GNAT family N-acetyltransferase [Meiothermus granaticius]|uniref:Spermidine N(1)-acetyltransferase n=1 Tax=Meiothermus granaticius NBRC 107808 TaxID=1227551 RepID=A0A399F7Q3_9DEIN|nr:GNAT family protein [Meiothermus granaticius]RIH91696.1 Spermidine N(1)-acetyltransferase [Meiothermus granaticius NBRC 107808]GEM88512.1 N-acetyltransferase [Meiothermus granaticius NBRC 107808]
MTLTGQERVQLRPVDLDDANKIQRWYAEPQVVEYAIIQPFLGYSLSEVQDLIKKWLGRDDRKLYVVKALEQNCDAGLVFLEHIDWKNRAVKIALLIGEPELRGRGLGQAALRSVIQLGCHDWGLHRLGANCLATNQVMIRCLEQVGFVQEGVMREAVLRHGRYQDLRIYSHINELHRTW